MVHVLHMIRDEHLSMSRLLGRLERQIELFENGFAADYELMNEIIEYVLTFPDLFHHPKENLILAKLRQRAPEIARKVGDLDDEHGTISRELHNFAHALSNVLLEVEMPRDCFTKMARAFIERERQHACGTRSSAQQGAATLCPHPRWRVRLSHPSCKPDSPAINCGACLIQINARHRCTLQAW